MRGTKQKSGVEENKTCKPLITAEIPSILSPDPYKNPLVFYLELYSGSVAFYTCGYHNF